MEKTIIKELPWRATMPNQTILAIERGFYLLQFVVKYTFGLPAVYTYTPSGGKGSSQTQTLVKEGIPVK